MDRTGKDQSPKMTSKGRGETLIRPMEKVQAGDYQGHHFELGLGMHILLKGVRDHQKKFSMCPQFSPAEKFDDVVAKVRLDSQTVDTYFCVQAKHEKIKDREPPSNLTDQVFSAENSEFNLLMYAHSYVKMKEHPIFQNSVIGGVILATNRQLEKSKIFEKVDNDQILIDLGPKLKLYQIREKARAGNVSKLLDLLKNGTEKKPTTQMPDEKKVEAHLKEFVERFYLAVNLPNQKRLEEEVKNQLSSNVSPLFSPAEVDLAFAQFQKEISSARTDKNLQFIGFDVFKKIKQKLVASSLRQSEQFTHILKSKVRFRKHLYEKILSQFKNFLPNQGNGSGKQSAQVILLVSNPVEGKKLIQNIEVSLSVCGFQEKELPKFQQGFFTRSSDCSDSTANILLVSSTSDDVKKSLKEGSEIYGKLKTFLNDFKNGKVVVVVTSAEISDTFTSLIEKAKLQCPMERWPESKVRDGTSFQEFLNSPIQVKSSVETVHQKILHFETEETELSVIRLEQALKDMEIYESSHQTKESYFFETITGLLGRPSEICPSFASSESFHLLVLFWDESTTTKDSNLVPIIGLLLLTVTKNPKKQLAFVTTKKLSLDVVSVFGELHKVICDKTKFSVDNKFWLKLMKKYEQLEESGKFKFESLLKELSSNLEIVMIVKVEGTTALTSDSLKDVLNTKVIFQGQNHLLQNLLDESSAKKVLTGEALTQLIQQEVICIGNEGPHLSDLESARDKPRIVISSTQLSFVLSCNQIDYFVFRGLSLQELEAFNPNSHLGTVVTWEEISNSSAFPHLILLEGNDHEAKFKFLCQQFHQVLGMNGNRDDQEECEPISIYLIVRHQSGFVLAETYSQQFYIPRRFYPITVDISKVTQIILDQNAQDYFVFSGTEENLLLQLMKFGNPTKEFNVTKKRLEVYKDEADASRAYRELTMDDQKTKEVSIHWLQVETAGKTSTVYWRRTHGNVSRLSTTRIEGNGKLLEEEHLVRCLDKSVVIVADDPGMGKSTTLSRIGERIKLKHPLIWTFKIDLNQHQTLINSYKDELTMTNFLEMMSDIDKTLKKPLPRLLFKNLLTKINKITNHKIFFLFDGFDEVSSEIKDVVLKLLKFVEREAQSICCITTRRHDRAKLENNLSALAHSFVPLTQEEPIKFLCQFWWSTSKLVADRTVELSMLKKCAEECVRLFEHSIHDRYKSFISIPLRARMLAEVFRNQAVSSLTSNNLDVSKSSYFDVGNNKFSLGDLYEKFIDIKYDMYLNEKLEVPKVQQSHLKQTLQSGCTASYSRLALKELFENDSVDLVEVDDDRYQQDTDTLLRIGLIQGSELSQTFIHRTFTEYFVAVKLVQILRSKVIVPSIKISWCTLILSKLFSETWSVIRAFMNDRLLRTPCLFDKESEVTCHWRKEVKNRLLTNKHIFAVIRENQIGLLKLLLDNTHDQRIMKACVNISGRNRRTPLHQATISGSHEIVKILVEKGSDINVGDSEGLTPLHRAAQWGYHEIVKILAEKGAELNTKDNAGRTPLHLAVQLRHHEIVEKLAEKGSDINEVDTEDLTPLHRAAQWGYHQIVKILAEKGAKINTTDDQGLTPLHWAAKWGSHENAKILIEKGAKINTKDSKSCTPLYLAAERGHHEIIKMLVENGAEINEKGSEGSTYLHLAAEQGDHEAVKILVEKGAEINTKDSEGLTPLHLAAYGGQHEIVKLLVEKEAKINAKDSDGVTPLHLAVQRGLHEIVKTLVEKGAELNTKDSLGFSPLHLAAEEGHHEIVKILVEKGAEINFKDSEGRTSLHLALQRGLHEIVKTLVEKGAEINCKDSKGSTYLHLAVQRGHNEIVNILVENGAEINEKISKGSTYLHLAAEQGHHEIVKILVEKGAEINTKDCFGFSSLHLAAEEGHHEIVKILVEKGAEINTKNSAGFSPLHTAAEEGHHETVKMLVENGAEINEERSNGSTYLHLAAEQGDHETVKILVEKEAEINTKDSKGDALVLAKRGNLEI